MTDKAPDLSPVEILNSDTVKDWLEARGHPIGSDAAPWPQDAADIEEGLITELNALAARVDALTKERDALSENRDKLNHAYREGRMKGREEALARLGAVQRETLDKAVDASGWTCICAARIATIPLDPDAAAALERALQAEREACSQLAQDKQSGPYDDHGRGWNDACEDIADSILARGQKDNTND